MSSHTDSPLSKAVKAPPFNKALLSPPEDKGQPEQPESEKKQERKKRKRKQLARSGAERLDRVCPSPPRTRPYEDDGSTEP